MGYSPRGCKVLDTTEWLQFSSNYGGGNEDNGDLPQKIPVMYCYSPLTQSCGKPPPTHAFPGDSWTPTGKSPVGSLFLSPRSWCTRFSCALQESISQSYVSSGSSIVRWMATSSKRTLAIGTSRVPVPEADHCQPVLPQETLKHSSVSVSVGSLGPVRTRFVWVLWVSLAGTGFDSKREIPSYHLSGASPLPLDVGNVLTADPVPTILLGFFWPWMWGISTQPLQHCAATTA